MEIERIIQQIKSDFETVANPIKAIGAAKYMKNKFVFFGVDATQRKAIQKIWFQELKKEKCDRWAFVAELWKQEQREFHYFAIDWMNTWKKDTLENTDISHLKNLIVSKSWWDSVDAIASNILGSYFEKFPNQIELTITEWRHDSNMWLNRSCLIFQLKYKNKVDFELLKSLIIQFQPNKEFFIQKAIGWSLRQYAKFNAEAVEGFVHAIQLTGLAKREALKHFS